MTTSEPKLKPILDDFLRRFGPQMEAVDVAPANELYIQTKVEFVAAMCAWLYRNHNARCVSVFAEDARNEKSAAFLIYYVLAVPQAGAFFILCAPVSAQNPELTSLTNALPALNWQEREIQDLFGVRLIGHPNPRRCALHDDWPLVYPLRKDFDLKTKLPPFQGERHKFRAVEGEGVFQVPVGPVHAGIIEPGHFLFSVAGEPVLYLQIRLFYTHKGTEKLFENISISHGVRLAESISGDSSFAHATAYCHAIERAAQIEATPRAKFLRSACLELERIYNHIADIGAIATDVSFAVANAHAMRLKERVLRLNEQLTGNRLLRGMACIGGVRYDWNAEQVKALETSINELEPQFASLVELAQNSSSTRDRLETTGRLTPQTAHDLGVVGIAGRASGFSHDLRQNFPHAGYGQVQFKVPVYQEGDVLYRMQVRIDEVQESFSILRQLISKLPTGDVRMPFGPIPPNRVALGYVEGWRGEIFHWVHTGSDNRLGRCKIKDPSLQNWPALSEAIPGNIVPDFPVVNKSFNLSYSGTDR
jgi:Ni,Fe-hydrogenase III large subunit/Ni,Fe-hydrogenase III component G